MTNASNKQSGTYLHVVMDTTTPKLISARVASTVKAWNSGRGMQQTYYCNAADAISHYWQFLRPWFCQAPAQQAQRMTIHGTLGFLGMLKDTAYA